MIPPSYRLARRVSHADVDFVGELKLGALLGMLEQAAVEASTAAGFGAERYTAEQRVWVIRRTKLRRLVPVGGGDEIDIDTEVADFRRARSLRRYRVTRGGEAVAEATTDWVYCDIASGKPTRVSADLVAALFGAEAPTLPRAEPLPAARDEAPVEHRLRVQPSHLDHVQHVNNAVYTHYLEDAAFALFAARGWPLTRMLTAGGGLRIVEIDAEYMKDANVDDDLAVRTWLVEGDDFGAAAPRHAELLQVIDRASGEILRARTRWRWRDTPHVLGGVPRA